jgi:hypothetical protein
MMRKLAVTVFALSLAALGCGSDSGNKNNDVGGGPGVDGAAKDTAGDVAQPDTSIAPDGAIDVTAKQDVSVDQNTVIDTAQVDGGPKVDATSVDTKVGVDGGAGVDTGSSIDTTAVDGGTVG